MMSFFAALLTFLMVGCSKPTNPITWTECAPEIGSHPCNIILNDILLEDRNGRPGSQGLARRWAETYGDDEPILTGYSPTPNWSINGLPTFYMIDDEMKIVSRLEGWSLIGVSQMIMETQN